MTKESISISFESYSSLEELSPLDRQLCEAAIEARRSSYAPYSHFNVGAAVRLEDGTVVKGSNQENVAYPSGLCAERNAMFSASTANPGVPMLGIAIAGGPQMSLSSNPVTPCGACRQVMAEYQALSGKSMSVLMVGSSKIWKFGKVEDLLPMIFSTLEG